MGVADIPDVHEIERASFPIPWPAYAFRQELEANRMARYLVVRAGYQTVAYAGLWLMVDEAHVTTFAVMPDWRRRGIGARLMLALLRLAIHVGASVATLEVRLSNIAARNLYQRFGFRPVGVRPRYYSDNGEDALIMTTDLLASPTMQRRLVELADRYGGEWLPDEDAESPYEDASPDPSPGGAALHIRRADAPRADAPRGDASRLDGPGEHTR